MSGDFPRCGTAILAAFCLISVAACSEPVRQPAQTSLGSSDWVTTPLILGAERTAQGLTLRGVAAPAGRVVVRGAAGVAYATSADDQGRFTLRIGSPAVDTLFVVETQYGQDAAPAPYRLLVTGDVGGPIALLTPGGPSHRLDMTGPLDAIDSDGRTMLASGRSRPGAVVPITIGGGAPIAVQTGPDGRWIEQMEGGASTISVGGRSYVRPDLSAPLAGTPLTVTAAAGGRRVSWSAPGGSAQQTWFPDAG
ncbi:hypothetical protein BH10PSE1_BH10PSE1_05200 [soil metagenome]